MKVIALWSSAALWNDAIAFFVPFRSVLRLILRLIALWQTISVWLEQRNPFQLSYACVRRKRTSS